MIESQEVSFCTTTDFSNSTPKQPCIQKWEPKTLFNALHLRWLDEYHVENNILQDQLQKKIKKDFPLSYFYKKAHWYGSYYRRDIVMPSCSFFYIRWIDSKFGFGLFARQALPKGFAIGPYLGLLRARSMWQSSNLNSYCFSFPLQRSWIHQIFHGTWTVDALGEGNLTRFINHSFHPNCKSIPAFLNGWLYILIHTTRSIAKDEQIFYNYGPDYWRSRSDLCQ